MKKALRPCAFWFACKPYTMWLAYILKEMMRHFSTVLTTYWEIAKIELLITWACVYLSISFKKPHPKNGLHNLTSKKKYAIYFKLKITSLFISFCQTYNLFQTLSPLIYRAVYWNQKNAHKSTMQIPKLLNILFIYSVDRDNDDS